MNESMDSLGVEDAMLYMQTVELFRDLSMKGGWW
jgi:hypothetical protein